MNSIFCIILIFDVFLSLDASILICKEKQCTLPRLKRSTQELNKYQKEEWMSGFFKNLIKGSNFSKISLRDKPLEFEVWQEPLDDEDLNKDNLIDEQDLKTEASKRVVTTMERNCWDGKEYPVKEEYVLESEKEDKRKKTPKQKGTKINDDWKKNSTVSVNVNVNSGSNYKRIQSNDEPRVYVQVDMPCSEDQKLLPDRAQQITQVIRNWLAVRKRNRVLSARHN